MDDRFRRHRWTTIYIAVVVTVLLVVTVWEQLA